MEKEPASSPPKPQAQQPLRIGGVHLKIVGESLGILQDFPAKLELTCSQEQTACRICFHEGERTLRVQSMAWNKYCPPGRDHWLNGLFSRLLL